MSETEETIGKLRRQIAELESRLDALRIRLAKAEAKLSGTKPAAPGTGLEMLWAAALPKARERSSRHRCRVEWNRIPIAERPLVKTLLDALQAWNRCEAWRCDGHAFVPGLHRFIKDRMWEDLPQDSRRIIDRPTTKTAPTPTRTEEDEAALREFLNLKPRVKS